MAQDSHCNSIHTCFPVRFPNVQSHFADCSPAPLAFSLDTELKVIKFANEYIF